MKSITKLKKGIKINNFQIDVGSVDYNFPMFISHAHSDHLPSGNGRPVLASDITIDLMNLFIKKRRKSYTPYYKYDTEELNKQTENLNISEIKLHNAGHITGANMISFTYNDKKILYTGDVSCKSTNIIKKPKIPKTDILILESTYGSPEYVFPKTKEVKKEIYDWIDDNLKKDKQILLYGYKLGKAQQLCSFLDEKNIPYTITPEIGEINKILSKNDIVFKGKELNGHMEDVIIAPSTIRRHPLFQKIIKDKPFVQGMATGWALNPEMKKRFRVDRLFPLSDHADFNELITIAKKSDANIIYTHHGQSESLARELKEELGVYAENIEFN